MFEKDLMLAGKNREAFKNPIGKELYDIDLESFDAQTTLITVGDVVSLVFRKHGIKPFLSIYDGKTERREMTEFAQLVMNEERKKVTNPAGMVTKELADRIRECIEGDGGLIEVEGEEDLALMPAILLSKPGTNIVYGWPGKCMMLITTDESIKSEIEQLMFKMEEIE